MSGPGVPLNLGFELAGANPGEAAGWTVIVVSTAQEVANYNGGAGAPLSAEAFDSGWSNDAYLRVFDPLIDLTSADYSAALVMPAAKAETFDIGWDSNEIYMFQLGTSTAASYGTALEDFEDFDQEWDSNESYITSFVGVGTDLVAAVYGAGTVDSFDTGWGNTVYQTTLTVGVDAVLAVYDGSFAPQDFEDFDQVLADVTILATNASTDEFKQSPSGTLTTDVSVRFVNKVGGKIPGGINGKLTYWIGDIDGTLFVVALSPWSLGGTQINLMADADDGTFATADPARYWGSDFIAKSF